ncbi:MAG: sulfatase [Pirellulales bacterium]|nr:sulfatase [Pirellulales bacterium]
MAGTPLAADVPAKKPPLNVLFIAVDDLRPELGCYGADYMHTPNIDRLAGQGALFSRAYCQQAVCNPSRASLMTGLRPDSTKVYDLKEHFRKHIPDVVTLSQHFMRHGYFAQGISKIYHAGLDDPQSWSVPHMRPAAPVYIDPEIRRDIQERQKKLEAQGIATSKGPPKLDPATGMAMELGSRKWVRVDGPAWEAPDVADNVLTDGKTADKAVELLGDFRKNGKPFFLAVGFLKPHLPFVAPKRYLDLYPPESIRLPGNLFAPKGAPELALTKSGELRNYSDVPDEGPISEELMRKLIRAYRACASFTDAQIGRVLDELDRQGLRENTVVVLWGDHGWHLGEHDIWGKMTNFEIATHAPLIISAPGQKNRGAKIEALAEFVDIYPTLCELCGLPAPDGLEGTSLVPIMNDPGRPWKTAAFSQYPRPGGTPIAVNIRQMGYSMRTDRHRYTEWRDWKTNEVLARELYDYRTDPQGNANVADEPANHELVAQLGRQLAADWRGAAPKQ